MSAVPSQSAPSLKAEDGSSSDIPAAPEGVPHLPAAAAGSQARVFYFLQKVPIPSYLIALAVGELEGRDLSDRWAVLPDTGSQPAARSTGTNQHVSCIRGRFCGSCLRVHLPGSCQPVSWSRCTDNHLFGGVFTGALAWCLRAN